MADMHFKGISLIHLYDEGCDMDYNVALYYYEKLCLKLLDSPEGAKWRQDPRWKASIPEFMTAIVRKQELREKVDVDFDQRVSLLEVLLYQYREFCNPADFCERSMHQEGEHPEITRARLLLEDVNAAIRAYEQEKQRLEEESKYPGVRGLTAKHTFAQLSASPLAEKLSTALIKAEAAVRKANRLFGNGAPVAAGSRPFSQAGAIYWMTADLEQKKTLYGRRAVAGHAIVGGRTTQPKQQQQSVGGGIKKTVPGKLKPVAPVQPRARIVTEAKEAF